MSWPLQVHAAHSPASLGFFLMIRCMCVCVRACVQHVSFQAFKPAPSAPSPLPTNCDRTFTSVSPSCSQRQVQHSADAKAFGIPMAGKNENKRQRMDPHLFSSGMTGGSNTFTSAGALLSDRAHADAGSCGMRRTKYPRQRVLSAGREHEHPNGTSCRTCKT